MVELCQAVCGDCIRAKLRRRYIFIIVSLPCHDISVQEAFNMLTIDNPSPEVLKQRRCMEYILRWVVPFLKGFLFPEGNFLKGID